MIGIDTSVLVRWLVGDDPDQQRVADDFFESLSADNPGFVDSVTMAELCWVLRSVYRYPKAAVLDALEGLLLSQELEFDDGESLWQSVLHARQGADFADALHMQTARLFAVDGVVTFDRGAASKLGMRLLS